MVATLDSFTRGQKCRILSMPERPACGEHGRHCCLRRMGLREGVTVEVVNDYDPVIIRFEGCCLALQRHLLAGIMASPCGGEQPIDKAACPRQAGSDEGHPMGRGRQRRRRRRRGGDGETGEGRCRRDS